MISMMMMMVMEKQKGPEETEGQARSQVLSNRVRSEVAFFKGFSFFLNFFLALTLFAFLPILFLAGANGWVCQEY